jgi:hypothetical protein
MLRNRPKRRQHRLLARPLTYSDREEERLGRFEPPESVSPCYKDESRSPSLEPQTDFCTCCQVVLRVLREDARTCFTSYRFYRPVSELQSSADSGCRLCLQLISDDFDLRQRGQGSIGYASLLGPDHGKWRLDILLECPKGEAEVSGTQKEMCRTYSIWFLLISPSRGFLFSMQCKPLTRTQALSFYLGTTLGVIQRMRCHLPKNGYRVARTTLCAALLPLKCRSSFRPD